MTEFELIRRYFAARPPVRADVRVGIGDDAAVVRPPAGMDIVITTDVLVADVHFFADVDPAALGHKALAVNLSDLAATGAEPAWFTLNLTLPDADPAWLQRFAAGMFNLADEHALQLVGGDTARGPLAVGITAIGLVAEGKGLLRSGARVGDAIYVTGALGDAALALAGRQGMQRLGAEEMAFVAARLDRPTPRVDAGRALRDIATSAIDVSDGLMADLGHVLAASGVGARIEREAVPVSPVYRGRLSEVGWDYALAGGDDYELCFTVPAAGRQRIESLARDLNLPLTRIGEITSGRELDVLDPAGAPCRPTRTGHDHFSH